MQIAILWLLAESYQAPQVHVFKLVPVVQELNGDLKSQAVPATVSPPFCAMKRTAQFRPVVSIAVAVVTCENDPFDVPAAVVMSDQGDEPLLTSLLLVITVWQKAGSVISKEAKRAG